MDYHIGIDEKNHYVFLSSENTITYDYLSKFILYIKFYLSSHNYRNILLDFSHAKQDIARLEHYRFAWSFKDHFPADVKLAILLNEEDFKKDAEYVDDVSSSLGNQMKNFTDKNSAIKWFNRSPY